jgi:D-serine deaminase-like pyridoxal phosphate-dependent protein
VDITDLRTPALTIDVDAMDHNIATMAEALPGPRLRPHVKAFKSTALARRLADAGHRTFCAATVREIEGMAAAGLGEDLLLANEVLDATRLGALVRAERARVTVAVDSDQTIAAAVAGGVREVLIDVNVGLPRCGCAPRDAGRLAERCRGEGLAVRGVMGYEGHVMGTVDTTERAEGCRASMELLARAHDDVGGDVISAGGTGTFALNTLASEIQAGSYVLMDTAYARQQLPFTPALHVVSRAISRGRARGEDYIVVDAGLKAFGMDHGNPSTDAGTVWFCSDEHTTIAPHPGHDIDVGDLVTLTPAHVDPTVARHEHFHLVAGTEVVDRWEIDLRHW